jgi:polyisoprenoid-binding protein YceI
MQSKFGQNYVTVNDLNVFLTANSGAVLIDLLPQEHFTNRHIPGAKNACVFQVSFLEDLTELVANKDASIVIYGAGSKSQDTAMALEKLDRAGFMNVSFLEGGLDAWSKAGYNLDGEATEQQDDPQTKVTLPDGQYTIDSINSLVEWAGRNPGTRHSGTVDIAKGTIDIKDGKITGTIEIDMSTIHNTNLEGDELQPVLEAHLQSDDFFFTKMFPKAVFAFKDAKRIEPGWLTAPNYHIDGELNLRGVTAGLEYDATVTLIQEDSFTLEAHFDMDRTRWGVIYGSTRFFEHLGMHNVFDLLSFQLRIVASL